MTNNVNMSVAKIMLVTSTFVHQSPKTQSQNWGLDALLRVPQNIVMKFVSIRVDIKMLLIDMHNFYL